MLLVITQRSTSTHYQHIYIYTANSHVQPYLLQVLLPCVYKLDFLELIRLNCNLPSLAMRCRNRSPSLDLQCDGQLQPLNSQPRPSLHTISSASSAWIHTIKSSKRTCWCPDDNTQCPVHLSPQCPILPNYCF